MREQLLRFGPQGSLIGTITQPDADAVPSAPLGLVLFNSGVVGRVGPHRINVKLARRIAEHGIPTIRFDLHGFGDSQHADNGADFNEQSVADLRQAMDCLQRQAGVQHFTLLGFCSGAIPSYLTAQTDPRVAAIVIYDAFAFTTVKSRLRYLWLRLRRHGFGLSAGSRLARVLLRTLRTGLRRGRSMLSSSTAQDSGNQVWDSDAPPSRHQIGRGLEQIVANGARVLLLHAGDDFSAANYPGQARAALHLQDLSGNLNERFLEPIDHAVTSLVAQRMFLDVVCEELMATADALRVQSHRTADERKTRPARQVSGSAATRV